MLMLIQLMVHAKPLILIFRNSKISNQAITYSHIQYTSPNNTNKNTKKR